MWWNIGPLNLVVLLLSSELLFLFVLIYLFVVIYFSTLFLSEVAKTGLIIFLCVKNVCIFLLNTPRNKSSAYTLLT